MSDSNNYGNVPNADHNDYGKVEEPGTANTNQPQYTGNYSGNYGNGNPDAGNPADSAAQHQQSQYQNQNNGSPAQNYANQQPPSYAAAMGYNNGAEPEKPTTPKTLKIASWFIYLTILVGIIGVIYEIANPDLVMQQAGLTGSDWEDAGLSRDRAEQFASWGMWMGVAFAFIQYALMIMFTIFMLKGANWARIVLTVLCGFGVFSIFSFIAVPILDYPVALAAISTVGGFASIGAIVFMFLRPSNEFFAKMRARKQWQAYNQYM